ncbi:hypothetical protein EI546_06105 [Aequorivita sp. H23M31]|uniref:Uncharacterized protein n=1 Tax=Aequorivita ciconiae TaxID=2494375 RepID=A0A410G214_9FLAO|nr:hypothetical protein [Aequorivita sp. H23M31]QAA81327.1 hypothetical protein EI546_06105 [Aequorivita sp. H23M31]
MMSKPPLNCITVSEARKFHDNWLKTRALYIEKGLGSPDVCEFLFTVDELQQFLDYVKAGTEKHEPGIRIYLAAYGTDKSEKATLFLAPTLGTKAGAENNYNLDPLNKGIQGWPPKKY